MSDLTKARASEWTPPKFASDEEYYSDTTHVSHSMLEVFRRSIPEYHGRFVAGTIERDEPTEAMRLGTLLHCAVLEPDKWANRRVPPECNKRTKAGKEAMAIFHAHANGHLVAEPEEENLVQAMAASLLAHPVVSDLLKLPGPEHEHIASWLDPDTLLPCKAKIDKACFNGLVLDIKSASDPTPEAFARACVYYGYHRQAAWYLRGALEELDLDGPFVFAVVGKTQPHEVAAYVLDQTGIDLANQQIAEDMRQLKQCYESKQWLSRLARTQTLRLPNWAFYQGSNQ